MLAGPPRIVSALTVFLLIGVVWFYTYFTGHVGVPSHTAAHVESKLEETSSGFEIPVYGPGIAESNYTRVLVIPKTEAEDVSWIERELPGLDTAIYEVENQSAPYHVPKNKGREAMVYLTYIIDHYDELPDVILFFHAHQYAWHNNILLDLDSAKTIRRLSPDRVTRVGYMNARCHLDPGCPDWIHMDRPEVDFDMVKKPEEPRFTYRVWEELYPGERAPPVLSQPCCAQFAVSRDAVRRKLQSAYIHYRDWLLNTALEDEFSGRVLEYTWQYIFTGNAEHCPVVHTCYCDGYGICFGSGAKLDEWLALFEKKEAARAELYALDLKMEGVEKIEDELRKKVDKLTEEVETRKREAYARGNDPKNRAIEAERRD